MIITKHAQSCFLVETEKSKILIDPGTYVFAEEGMKAEDFSDIDVIIVTHEHSDHFDWENVQKIIEMNGPVMLGTIAVIETAREEYPDLDCRVNEVGMTFELSDIKIEGVVSEHGPLPNGNTPPEVVGVVIDDGKSRFYTPGDSTFLDQKTGANIIAAPICGQVVMDIATAREQVLLANPMLVIPIHYDNSRFPVDVQDFESSMDDTDIQVKVLGWGESVEV
ncbi:MAG: MBL fold metallo-hydrolase [Candidatus Berkelbacteria bacterium]